MRQGSIKEFLSGEIFGVLYSSACEGLALSPPMPWACLDFELARAPDELLCRKSMFLRGVFGYQQGVSLDPCPILI